MPCYPRTLSRGIRWRYAGSHLGVTYCSRSIYHTKKEAKAAERAEIERIDKAQTSVHSNMSLGELMLKRLYHLQVKSSDKHRKECKRYYQRFLRAIGDKHVVAVTRQEVESVLMDYSLECKESGADNYAVNSMLRALKALFYHAINELEIDIKNPVKNISRFPIKQKLKYIPPDEEIDAVLAICNPEQRALVEFVRDTGVRINEALSLTYNDVFNDYVVVYTNKSLNSDRVPRKIPYKLNKTGKGRVFPHWTEKPEFLRLKVQELKLSSWAWHNLRHRYASLLSKNNVPLFEVMSLLGHTQISTTQRYLQLLK